MNVPVEIKIYDHTKTIVEVTTEPDDGYDYELRVDKVTRDWILRVQDEFAGVQAYLRSIHPDYMEC